MDFKNFKLPDSRGWFSIALIALTVMVFIMLDVNPDLAKVPLFATLAQTIVITALVNLAASFYFGDSKSRNDGGKP